MTIATLENYIRNELNQAIHLINQSKDADNIKAGLYQWVKPLEVIDNAESRCFGAICFYDFATQQRDFEATSELWDGKYHQIFREMRDEY